MNIENQIIKEKGENLSLRIQPKKECEELVIPVKKGTPLHNSDTVNNIYDSSKTDKYKKSKNKINKSIITCDKNNDIINEIRDNETTNKKFSDEACSLDILKDNKEEVKKWDIPAHIC